MELLNNNVVCGGNARFKGMDKRLNKELEKVLFGRKVAETLVNVLIRKNGIKNSVSMDIIDLILKYEGSAQYEQICDGYATIEMIMGDQYIVWCGGSMMAMDETFESQCITTEHYEVVGPSVLDKSKWAVVQVTESRSC